MIEMLPYTSLKNDFERNGFAVLPEIFSTSETAAMKALLDRPDAGEGSGSRVYAIRNLLHEVPALAGLLAQSRMMEVVREVFGPDYFNVKGIYFDKPADFNWTVAWHQDLIISVNRRMEELPGFSQWSSKSGLTGVRPPLAYTQNIRTLRIHLDACDESNGALRVMPGSHREGVLRYGESDAGQEVVTCRVPEGGAMLMSPLLMHSSHRSSGGRRRVIHLEFSNMELPDGLAWAERQNFSQT